MRARQLLLEVVAVDPDLSECLQTCVYSVHLYDLDVLVLACRMCAETAAAAAAGSAWASSPSLLSVDLHHSLYMGVFGKDWTLWWICMSAGAVFAQVLNHG
jgi:hypothetical protein